MLVANVTGGTFRDPAGSLFDFEGSILRLVKPSEVGRFEDMLRSDVLARLVDRGSVVGTRRLEAGDIPDRLRHLSGTWFKHDRVPFVSVPAEWSAAMLAEAALHTIAVNLELVRHGYILKDATPANVLFNGTEPVIVDVPSIEPLIPGRDVWVARHQFETTFLLPLMARIEAGLPIQWTLSDPVAGLAHEQCAQLLGVSRWWGMDRIRHVALPAALTARTVSGRAPASAPASPPGASALRRTQYVLERSLRALQHTVTRYSDRIDRRQSHWSEYEGTRDHYSAQDLTDKRVFVAKAIDAVSPDWVLDIGANTGEFSEYAASRSAVVALDVDEVSVSSIYRRARRQGHAIHPLVMDLVRPTPASGWKNSESKSFLQRAQGRFDLTLMLAVAHHLRVSGGVPLEEIIDLGCSMGQKGLIFEFVPVDDPMFSAIARGRESIYSDYSLDKCVALLEHRGRIAMRSDLANGRTMFLLSTCS